jgi:hypothetical protein
MAFPSCHKQGTVGGGHHVYDPENEKFSLVSIRLASRMSGLSNNAWKLFVLLLLKIDRKSIKISKTREPTKKSNSFKLSYQDFKLFGIPRASFKIAIIELSMKGFIDVDGSYSKKTCKILVW